MPRLLVLAALVTIIPYIVFFSPFLKIRSVEVAGGKICVPAQLSPKDLDLSDKNLLTLSTDNFKKALLAKYPCLKEISTSISFPAKLKLQVQVQSEVLKIANTDLFLTEEQIVSDKAGDSQLPILYPLQNISLKAGEKVQDELIAHATKLTVELSKSDFTPASVRIVDRDSIAVYNHQDLVAIFSAKKSLNEQVDSLQFVLSKAKIDAAKIAKIDLRFDKPVISYRQ